MSAEHMAGGARLHGRGGKATCCMAALHCTWCSIRRECCTLAVGGVGLTANHVTGVVSLL